MGDIDGGSEKPSKEEKVVIVGFSIFILLVLTAYTATCKHELF